MLLTEFLIEYIEFEHYVLIDHISFFKKRHISEKNGSYTYSNTIFCTKCFEHFRSENLLNIHKEICGKRTNKKVFPSEDQSIHYNNHEYNFKRIFTGYADFESILIENTSTTDCDKCDNSTINDNHEDICPHSFTTILQNHYAISVSFVIVDRHGKLVHEFCYTGEDVVLKFMNNVLKCEDLLVNVVKFYEYMLFDEDDKKTFDRESICFICKNKRLDKGLKEYPFSEFDPKVRDHDHLTGKYLDAAHRSCNLNKRREKPFLSIFMHNFSGYDSHLILPFLTKKLFPGIESVNVIPKSGEKFMSIKINQKITFLDSMSFLSGSLDSLNESF